MQITNKELRNVNKQFRASDDSSLWPICGRFSVAERAIRRARELMRANGPFSSAYEYRAVLDGFASQIVNDPKNQ